MRRLAFIIILSGIIYFVHVKSYAADKKYYLDDANTHGPNYNNPTKPNYMSGTRTDMAPKIEVSTNRNEETEKELSQGQQMLIRTIVPRNTIGERVKNVGESTAAGAIIGAGGGLQGAAEGAVGGALQGTAEEAIKDVKYIATGKNEE